MKKILLTLASLIAFCCAMRAWQFNIPPRIFIFDLLALLFIAILLLSYSVNRKPFFLPRGLKYFILLQCGWLFIMVVSGLTILFPGASQEAFFQYFKGIISTGFHTIFFVLLILFLSSIAPRERNRILSFFIMGVICSCIYEFGQVALYKFSGINLDSYIWDQLSFNVLRAHSFDAPKEWAVLGITRATGFPVGEGSAATYVVTILPMLLLGASLRRKSKDIILVIIAVLGLLLTMSRTGMMAFAVSLLVLIILERRWLFSLVKSIFVISVPLGYLAYVWWGYISEILKFRTHVDFSRLALFQGAIHLFTESPLLGVGANNYSVARLSLPSTFFHDANVHNSWLTILVELGIVGLLFKVVFFVYIIYVASRRRSLLSCAFICTIVGLSAGALFNQVFDLFYFNFYVALVFATVVLEDVPLRPARRLATSIRLSNAG